MPRATGRVPAELLAEERQAAALSSVESAPGRAGTMRLPVSVGPTAMVEHETNKYSMPPQACGLSRHAAPVRGPCCRSWRAAIAPSIRACPPSSRGIIETCHRSPSRSMLAAVSGKRGRQYQMREHLFQLGPAGARKMITEIIYTEQRLLELTAWSVCTNCSSCTATTPCAFAFERHRGQSGCRVADIAREFAHQQCPLPFADSTNE